jgi:hypothetical protein
MCDIPIALIEAGLLLAIGHASRRRAVLLLAALGVGCVAVLRVYPGLLMGAGSGTRVSGRRAALRLKVSRRVLGP